LPRWCLQRLICSARLHHELPPLGCATRLRGVRPPGLGTAPRRLYSLRRPRGAESPPGRPPLALLRIPYRLPLVLLCIPHRLPLASHLPAQAHVEPEDGICRVLSGVVGVDALLLQALPHMALQPPSSSVLLRRPLERLLLSRRKRQQATGALLAQPQHRKGPAAPCHKPTSLASQSQYCHRAPLLPLTHVKPGRAGKSAPYVVMRPASDPEVCLALAPSADCVGASAAAW
jgi:hypothetical protein